MSSDTKISQDTIKLDKIEDAIEDIRQGKIVIVVDDEDRENEGDFICAAETITPEHVNFMARYGRGLICTPIEESRAKELDLELMVKKNSALHETAFTVSIDLLGQGCTTGISAYDRSTGIRALVDPNTKPNDYARPGHIFPLIAKSGGVLRRTGHTEATIDLARLAGLYPAGVLTEILNEDGSMARLPQLIDIAKEHNMRLISIKDLVAYRMRTERLIERVTESTINTKYGDFKVNAYRQLTTGDIHFALSMGNVNSEDPVLTRVHSNTETGDILGILFDGYADKLHQTLYKISEEGKGVLLYMRHGEKGDEIIEKLRNIDTNPDNNVLPSNEQRDFGVGAQILRDLGVRKLRLMTDNPRKRVGLIGYGLEIVENIDLA